jgi:hypothetical protein
VKDSQPVVKPRRPRRLARENYSLVGWVRLDNLPIGGTLARKLIDLGILAAATVGRPGSKRGTTLVSVASFQAWVESTARQQGTFNAKLPTVTEGTTE